MDDHCYLHPSSACHIVISCLHLPFCQVELTDSIHIFATLLFSPAWIRCPQIQQSCTEHVSLTQIDFHTLSKTSSILSILKFLLGFKNTVMNGVRLSSNPVYGPDKNQNLNSKVRRSRGERRRAWIGETVAADSGSSIGKTDEGEGNCVIYARLQFGGNCSRRLPREVTTHYSTTTTSQNNAGLAHDGQGHRGRRKSAQKRGRIKVV